MKPTVHILATVRDLALLPAALLVFKTLRTGFPTATVNVWGNALPALAEAELARAASAVGAKFLNVVPTSHDAWIELLTMKANEPLWICDTDLVFLGNCEFEFRPDVALAGRHEPEFREEWTQTTHVERLHTALMYLNPVEARSAMRAWIGRFPEPWRNTAQYPFFRQTFVGHGREVLFYDSTAGLYHACGHQRRPFSDAQNARFEHLHCATYVDKVDAPGLAGLAGMHAAVYADPARARGLQAEQAKYYRRRR